MTSWLRFDPGSHELGTCTKVQRDDISSTRYFLSALTMGFFEVLVFFHFINSGWIPWAYSATSTSPPKAFAKVINNFTVLEPVAQRTFISLHRSASFVPHPRNPFSLWFPGHPPMHTHSCLVFLLPLSLLLLGLLRWFLPPQPLNVTAPTVFQSLHVPFCIHSPGDLSNLVTLWPLIIPNSTSPDRPLPATGCQGSLNDQKCSRWKDLCS